MAERQIGVEFQSSYQGNIAKHLEEEKKRFLDFQKWMDANPLSVSVKLDMNGIKAQAASIRDIIMGEVGKGAGGGGIVGPDGRAASASIKELSKVQGLLQEINTTKFGPEGESQFLTQVEQIGNGLQRISKFKKDEAGDFQLLSSAEKDVRTVKQLEDGLRRVNKELGAEFSGAAGRGDKEGQLAALRKQKAEVDKLVTEAAKGGLVGSSAYTKAENQQDRLGARISGMEGGAQSAAEKKARADRTLEVNKAIKAEEARATAALKANKLEADQAERLLPDRAKYESEINRIYADRRRIFEQSKAAFQQMDKALLGENRPDLANKAFNRGLGAQSQIGQSDLDLSRTMTDSTRRGAKELETEKAKQLAADVTAGQKRQKEYESEQAKRLASDVDFGQKMIREKAAKEREARESGFRREIQDIKAQHEQRIAAINRQEKQEIAAATSKAKKLAAIEKGSSLRQDEYQNTGRRYGMVEGTARAGGFTGTADNVRGKVLGVATAAAKDMERFEVATRKSGHALDFHSSSLLRNAGTFLRWQIPMQAVMAVQRAFMAGVQGAILVDRRFATLQTVFAGTAQEAQMLKKETLDLAAAQGRSADEAMDSSIRWSRLGLTRVQVLEATRVSLMAANVAEITAAEAAEKLSGIYATYRLNVGDLAGVLNRLNSISNNYNVTVDDLFQGISRVSGVAKSSGLALRDLEGIIGSVVGAGGGSGAEVGNALKTVLVRLGDPKVGANLKKAFDVDLTGPNGDLKDMSQILRELADLYPTLNKAEQQRLLYLASGSRQASRFSKVMTEFRQGQILAAEAGFDTTASLRENEKILASLQSRIDSVKSSWVEFATALGDAGAMERAGQFMRYLQQIIQGYSDRIDEATKKTQDFTVNNPMYAEAVEKLGGGKDTMFGTRTKFDEAEVRKTLALMKEAKALQSGPTEGFVGRGLEGFTGKKISVANGMSGMSLTPQEIDKAIAAYEKLLGEGGDDGFKNEIQSIVKDVNDLREELGAMDKSSGVFTSLGASFANGKEDRQTMLRDFQAAAHLLLQLDDGTNLYAQSVTRFNQILASGDTGKMAEFLAGLAQLFKDQGKPVGDKLAAQLASAVPKLDAKLIQLKAERDALMQKASADTPAGRKEKQESLDDNLSKTKEVKAQIEQINQAVEKSTETAFGTVATAKINNYIDDVMAAAKAFGEAFKDFAPDAENDPVERIMQRHRRSLEMGRDALIEVQRVTNDRSKETRVAAESEKDPEIRQKIIDQQNEADVIVQSRIDSENERLEQLQRELDYEQAILNIKKQQTDSAKEAERSSQAWRFGETDSDKEANQARGAIERARRGRTAASARWMVGMDTPQTRADAAGQVLQDEATARKNLESMQQRNYQIDAARRQIAYDLVKAEREQTEEASKRFQMASREDQLRAAVLKRTITDKGALSQNEFSMLSQNSRQAVTNYLPNDAPGMLNEARSAADKNRRELDAEQGRLKDSIAEVSAALKILAENVTKDTARGGSLDPLDGALPPKPVQDAAITRDTNPVVNINLQAINLQVKLSEQLAPMLNTYVDQVVRREVQAAETRMRQQPIPNPQGSVE